jgi:hypothetical protein
VNANVSVLTTRGVCSACGVDIDSVQRTKVTLHSADFFADNGVPETSLELSLAGGGCGDIHGGLTTTENHEALLWCDACSVEGSIGDVGFEDSEVTRGDELRIISACGEGLDWSAYFSGLVLGRSDEAEPIGGHLEIGNCGVELMDLDVLNDFSSLRLRSVFGLESR